MLCVLQSSCFQLQRCQFIIFFQNMNHTTAVESDASSTNGDVIDMDVGENAAIMLDEEVQSELKEWDEKRCKDQRKSTISGTKILGETPLATPKIPSVVVIPGSSLSHRLNIGMRRSSAELNSKSEKPKRNRNRNGSAKSKASKSEGTLAALLSKFTMSSTSKESKQVDEQMSKIGSSTPENIKRIRSAGTTPEGGTNQPDKVAKFDTESSWGALEVTKSRNSLERSTLNVKVSFSRRPPTGKELQEIKMFLQYQIEQALEHRADFIPLFSAPCKIGRDGVYIYCADLACEKWVTYIAKTGIPGFPDALVVVPQETQMKFDPTFVMVRVVSKIPTKQPKDKILDNLAQLNRDLNTDSWQIKSIRPKGSSSMVYMRIDKRSFDTITERGSTVNWILGPININMEEHNSRSKTQTQTEILSSEADKSVNENKFRPHSKPPSDRSVEHTPRGTGLTRNGESDPKGSNERSYHENDGPAKLKAKVKVA